LLPLRSDLVHSEEWTNLRATSTVSAELVGIWNGRAILRLNSGKQVSVKLEDLNADSRIRAQDMQEEIERRLGERVVEMEATAKESASPAPTTIAPPEPAPPYQPPRENAELQSALDSIKSQAEAGHLRVFFDTLPASQQASANELFKVALKRLDMNSWELFRSTMRQLAAVVVTKPRWLFSHSKFSGVSDANREACIDLATAFQLWSVVENAGYNQLASANLSDVVGNFDETTSPYLYRLFRQNPAVTSIVFPSYQVEVPATGPAVAKIVVPFIGTIQSVPMVPLESRWAEGATVEEATAKWDTYKKNLEAIPASSVRLGMPIEQVLRAVGELCGKLSATPSRTAFHRTLDEGLVTLMPLLNAWAGVQVQPGGNGQGYGGDYGNMPPDGGSGQAYAEQMRQQQEQAAQRNQ